MIPLRDTIAARSRPLVTRGLIAVNVVVFLVQLGQGPHLDRFIFLYGLVPARYFVPEFAEYFTFGEQALALLSFMFLHGGFGHLLGNLWSLYIFGDNVEDHLGPLRYLAFYLLSGLASGLAHMLIYPESTVPTIGASGAIAGVMGAYFLLFPGARILTLVPILFIPYFFEIPAFFYLGIWFLLQFLNAAGASGEAGGVAWWAHIGGFVFGMLLVKIADRLPRAGLGDPLRRLAARLAGEPGEFWREHEIDAAPLIAAAPGLEKYPKASSICILDLTVTRIYRDGSQVDYVHQVFKILDQHGVDRYHTIELPGEVLEIRTHATDGQIYEPIVTDNTSEILMPKLEPGAVIEYRYRRVAGAPPAFQFDSGSFFFKDPNFAEPFVLSRFVVIADPGLEFETIVRNFPGKPSVEARGDTVVYAWELRDSDRIDEEPFMPEKEEILPYVRLLERRTWDDVLEVYRDRTAASGRTRLTPELRAKAAEIAGGAESEAERARRLYEFARDHIRTDGAGNDANEALLARAGSRTVLFKALLDAAGVPSRWALVAPNPRLAPEPIWDPPRPELFRQEMLVVEPRDGEARWIFDGGRHLPYGLVPGALRGAPAILIGERGAEFRSVPEAGPDDGRTETRTAIAVKGRGARVERRVVVHDAHAYSLKERVAKAQRAQLETFVEAQLAGIFLAPELVSFDFPGAETPGVPFQFAAEANVPGFVEEREGAPSIRTGLERMQLTAQLGGETARDHPVLLRRAQRQRDEATIDLGEEYEVESVPPDLLLRAAYGSYSLTFDVERNRIHIVRAFAIEPARIEVADYPEFLRYLRRIDEAESKRIYLRRRAQRP